MNNWKTTIAGSLTAFTGALTILAALPAQLGAISTIIPEQAKSNIVTIGLIATVILHIIKSVNTQDAAPAAGSSAAVRNALLMVGSFIAGGALAILTACATDSGDPKKDQRARVTNAVLQSGGDFLGRVAFATLSNAAQSAVGGEKIDLAHSAAAGLWSQSASIITSGDVQRVVDAYGGGKLTPIAVAAASAFAKADPQSADARKVVINSLAQSLSESAFNATGKP